MSGAGAPPEHTRAPVLVYGLGRSGSAALQLLARQGHPLEFFEARAEGDDVRAALALGARRLQRVAEARARVCVAAPGVPIDHPDLEALRRRGVEVIGEVEWVQRTVPGTYVGVTGTAGKGTVTSWIAATLQAAGRDAVAGGNLDPALAAVARPGGCHVVELSSFQLERTPTFHPRVAVLLNLGVDHLDRHRTVAAYHAAKHQLVRNLQPGDTLVINLDQPELRRWAAAAPPGVRLRGFSLAAAPPPGGSPAAARLHGDRLLLDERPLLGRDELRVRGDHQVANALAVALACRALDLQPAAIAAGLRAFEGLPGRYAEVGRLGGVRVIEDSIATRPLAVAAALRATPAPLVWIAGGVDKGARPEELLPLLEGRVTLFVGVGASGAAWSEALAPHLPTLRCAHPDGREALRCALRSALEHLRRHHRGHGSVLLAPLAASFDQFRDYRERARVFREVVAEFAAEREATPPDAAPGNGTGNGSGNGSADETGERTAAPEGGDAWIRCS